MLMPIVSMNKMAMNESVATTCCYRHMTSATNVYWEVLNGGWIGNGYVDELVWLANRRPASRYPKDITWTTLGLAWGGWASQTAAFGSITEITITEVYDPAGLVPRTTYVVSGGAAPTLGNDMHNLIGSGIISISAACSHDTVDCAYREMEISYAENRHFQSEKKHDTASDWTKAHEASAFNS